MFWWRGEWCRDHLLLHKADVARFGSGRESVGLSVFARLLAADFRIFSSPSTQSTPTSRCQAMPARRPTWYATRTTASRSPAASSPSSPESGRRSPSLSSSTAPRTLPCVPSLDSILRSLPGLTPLVPHARPKNGRVLLFLNDTLVLSHTNLQLRSSDSIASVSGLWFSTFFGGSDATWASPSNQSSYYRNFQIQAGAAVSDGPGNTVSSSNSSSASTSKSAADLIKGSAGLVRGAVASAMVAVLMGLLL